MSVHKSTAFCMRQALNVVATAPVAMWTTMVCRVYGGSIPTTADAAAPTLLLTITGPAAAALTWAATAPAGVLVKSAQVQSGVVTGAGTQTATYFRYCESTDTDALDTTTYPRLQGAVANAGQEFDLSATSLVNGATVTLNAAALSVTPN